MSEYTRLGAERFWNLYEDEIKAIDENVVDPVLTSVSAKVIGHKWRMDGNGYGFEIAGKGTFFVLFDVIVPTKAPLVEITVQKREADDYTVVGKTSVQFFPDRKWVSARVQFKELIA